MDINFNFNRIFHPRKHIMVHPKQNNNHNNNANFFFNNIIGLYAKKEISN